MIPLQCIRIQISSVAPQSAALTCLLLQLCRVSVSSNVTVISQLSGREPEEHHGEMIDDCLTY